MQKSQSTKKDVFLKGSSQEKVTSNLSNAGNKSMGLLKALSQNLLKQQKDQIVNNINIK
jgi:hypothetical protein